MAVRTARTRSAARTNVQSNGSATADSNANNSRNAKFQSADDGAKPELPFWEFLVSLGDQWLTNDLKLYLYRVWPVIDKHDANVYLSVVGEPIDEEFLLRHFGSGRYLLMLKDRRKLLRKHTVSIHNPAYPPNVNESEVLADSRNDSYFKTWGRKSSTEGKGKKEPAKDGETADIAEILRAHAEGSKLDPQVVSWLQDMANHRDDLATKLAEASAKNPTADLASLISAVKSLMPGQTAAAVDPLAIVDRVLAIQNRSETDIDKVWKLVEKAQGRGEPQPSPMHAMKETIELLHAGEGVVQTGNAARRSSGQS